MLESCTKEKQESAESKVLLESHEFIRGRIQGSLDPEIILMKISQLFGRTVDEKTPVFFDEIQCCERAVTAMKYFCESEKNYRILCAGSLLGIKIRRFHSSFSGWQGAHRADVSS